MYKNYSVLLLIPARGGSKRIPHKNIRLLAGRPLITYAIAAARGSAHVDRVIVSTDSSRIAKIAKRAGAEASFLRPKKLAGDTAPIMKTVLHALEYFKKREKWEPDIFVLVQPTSPFVLSKDIDAAIETLFSSRTNSCVSVSPITERPEWMFTLVGSMLRKHFPATLFRRSQDFPILYRLNGAVYAVRTKTLIHIKQVFDPKKSTAIVMPRERSIDIDYPIDLTVAEAMLRTTHRST